MRSAAAPVGDVTTVDAPRSSFGGQSSSESATRLSQAFALWFMLYLVARRVPRNARRVYAIRKADIDTLSPAPRQNLHDNRLDVHAFSNCLRAQPLRELARQIDRECQLHVARHHRRFRAALDVLPGRYLWWNLEACPCFRSQRRRQRELLETFRSRATWPTATHRGFNGHRPNRSLLIDRPPCASRLVYTPAPQRPEVRLLAPVTITG